MIYIHCCYPVSLVGKSDFFCSVNLAVDNSKLSTDTLSPGWLYGLSVAGLMFSWLSCGFAECECREKWDICFDHYFW